MSKSQQRCGFVAIIGRPNVGKSTLLNQLLGQKISIVAPKAQTTRHKIVGIKTADDYQLIFLDTPGLHRGGGRQLNTVMNKAALSVLSDADVILFVIEWQRFTDADQWILERLKQTQVPIILVMNKIDTCAKKDELLPKIAGFQAENFTAIVPYSARRQQYRDQLIETVVAQCPVSEHFYYEAHQVTDRSPSFLVAERLREQLVLQLGDELPYATTVSIEHYAAAAKRVDIHALIWVEREGQKAIVIGQKGQRLKRIASEARAEIEAMLGKQVVMQVWVKVKSDWSDDPNSLKQFGFDVS